MSFNYSTISNFGPNAGMSSQNDPLTYCVVSGLDSGFNHTIGGGDSLLGPNSSQCQIFMGAYCGNKWDGICEYLSNENTTVFPNTVSACNGPMGSCAGPGIGNVLTKGQFLLRNAAADRFLAYMSGNCVRVYESFDPTVASSPMISKWIPTGNSCSGFGNCNAPNVCIPVYDVDVKTIDDDIVMNKILSQWGIASDILINIYNNRIRTRRMGELADTKIGKLFASSQFQKAIKG